jgi:anti-sigma-K factor RskA
MSDADDTDTPDMLAAEYVLGTLASNEREQAQNLIASDPAFAALVRSWEQRIGQLQAMVAAVEPPPETWSRIQARIAGVEPSAGIVLPQNPDHVARIAAEGNVVDLRKRVGRWRRAAAGLAAIAAVLLAFVTTSAYNPELLPAPLRPKPVEIVKVVEKTIEKEINPGRFVAVLQPNAASPAFILTVDVANRTASVRRVAGGPPPGKSYELWLVSDRFPAPRSLGLVGTNDFTRPAALANYDPAVISNATFAVSLEPEGGSPNGQPTEVLFASKLIESVEPSR